MSNLTIEMSATVIVLRSDSDVHVFEDGRPEKMKLRTLCSFPFIGVVFCTLSTALRVFRQPNWGEAPRRPPGPRRSFPAAFRQPAVQSHLLVDEHLHHLCTQTAHRSESHRKAAHCYEGPHQLHQAAQGLRGPEGVCKPFSQQRFQKEE